MQWDEIPLRTDKWTGQSYTEWKSTDLERNEPNFNDARAPNNQSQASSSSVHNNFIHVFTYTAW